MVDDSIPDFAAEFSALGVVFNMDGATNDEYIVKDKPGRVKRITETVENIIVGGTSRHDALSGLRGLVGFNILQEVVCNPGGVCGCLDICILHQMPQKMLNPTIPAALLGLFWRPFGVALVCS